MAKLLFEDDPSEHYSLKAEGLTDEQIRERSKAAFVRTEDVLRRAEQDLLIFSAEDLSVLSPEGVQRARDFFKRFCDDIRVIGYVRPPISYITSEFQQGLKGGTRDLDVNWNISCDYRNRVEKFDSVFGEHKVKLKLCRRDKLRNGDVVLDIASEIGVPIRAEEVLRRNEALTLEAIAFIYVQRKFGNGYVEGFPGSQVAYNDFVETLNAVGERKMILGDRVTGPALDSVREQIEWMENRLGERVVDDPLTGRDAVIVNGEEDLLRFAVESRDRLSGLSNRDAELSEAVSPAELAPILDDIRRERYDQCLKRQDAAAGRARPADR